MVSDSFWRVADGSVEPFDGDLDDYARWLRSRGSAAKKAKNKEKEAKPVERVETAEERRLRTAAERENDKASRSRVKKIETRIATLEGELATLEAKLADPATYNGPTAEMMRLSQKQTELRREKETLEVEWLALYEQLEA
jgi:ATP-binding cassette subfamily F protein 3